MTALFVDARNVLYRAVYGSIANTHRVKYHSMVLLLRQFANWIRIHKPTSVHVFWDAKRDTVWRKKILSTYKDRDNKYLKDISEELKIGTDIATELFKNLNVRQYYRDTMEADDLIYAAVTVYHPKRTIIISTDSDLLQIPFNFSSASVYNPKKEQIERIPEINPAMMKAIVGDKTDKIDGYVGIGPKKGTAMLQTLPDLYEFLKIRGTQLYHRNLLLTDLSLCPRLMPNKLYIQSVLAEPVSYNSSTINDITRKYKILGLDSEYADIISPFVDLT